MRKQIFLYFFLLGSPTLALAQVGPRKPSYQLMKKGGQTAALSNGGIATVRDMSAIDSNPAGIAMGREVAVSSEMHWQNDKSQSVEIGVTDGMMAEVAAGLKARQTTLVTGGVDRRFSLAIAEQIASSPFALGIGADYIQIASDSKLSSPLSESTGTVATKVTKGENIRARFGAIYSLSPQTQIGVASDGYFDRYNSEKETSVGVATNFNGYYIFNGDVAFNQDGIKQYAGGVTLIAKEYLDVYGSYSFAPQLIKSSEVERPSHHKTGFGFVLKSSKFRIFYAASKVLVKDSDIEHYVGASLTLAM